MYRKKHKKAARGGGLLVNLNVQTNREWCGFATNDSLFHIEGCRQVALTGNFTYQNDFFGAGGMLRHFFYKSAFFAHWRFDEYCNLSPLNRNGVTASENESNL
ncbi:hypothetical protein OLZ31_19120 [Enterobacter asburiae]|nr:hypothetical protein [Enterobacter asburiae]